MKMINSFDPSVAASGDFKHQVANPCGGVYTSLMKVTNGYS